MVTTPPPQTHVRFGRVIAVSPQSPLSDAGSIDSTNASSTIQYVNSQLVAHGFLTPPGLSLDGLSSVDSEKVVKCFLAILGQVANDVSQSEHLTGKVRTLSYENDRMSAMHQQTVQTLAASEREINLYKAKLNAADKALQASEVAHKATSQELQRMKSTVQTIRQTHSAEQKRREKEAEKLLDRWTKLSDSQLKIGSAGAGIRFRSTLANEIDVTRDDEVMGRGTGLLEQALEEAELARKELVEEIGGLKGIVLASANELARTVHTARRKVETVGAEAPFFTMSDLFPPTPLGLANENFKILLSSLQETLKRLSLDAATDSTGLSQRTHSTERQDVLTCSIGTDNPADHSESRAKSKSNDDTKCTHEDRAKALVRRAANLDGENESCSLAKSSTAQISKEALCHDPRDAQCRDETGRKIFDSVDDKLPLLGDTSPLEDGIAETLEFSSFKVRRKGKDETRRPATKKVKSGSPFRSPMKMSSIRKPKQKNASRTSGSILKSSMLLGQAPPDIVPSFETEVLPNPLGHGSVLGSNSQSLIVPSAFVLPPPSPLSLIPPQRGDLSPLKQSPVASSSKLQVPAISPPDHPHAESTHLNSVPSLSFPFPVAKPQARNMFHAYSPARPSPLSHILMVANPPADGLCSSYSNGSHDVGPEGGAAIVSSADWADMPDKMLDDELGIDEDTSEENSPLREKTARSALASKNGKMKLSSEAASVKLERGFKAKIRTKKSGKSEKENENENAIDRNTLSGAGILRGTGKISPIFGMGKTTAPDITTRTKRANAGGKGGPRRVPIGSADAAPIGPGWK